MQPTWFPSTQLVVAFKQDRNAGQEEGGQGNALETLNFQANLKDAEDAVMLQEKCSSMQTLPSCDTLWSPLTHARMCTAVVPAAHH